MMLRLSERSRRSRLLLIVLLVASIGLVTLDFRSDGDGPLTKIGDGFAAVLGPLQDGIARVTRPIGNFFSGFGQVGSLKGRIRDLEAQLAALQQDQSRVLSIVGENDDLRAALGMRAQLGLRTKAAEVIGKDSSNFEEALVIDLGTRDGIAKGMAVVAAEGLVGRVVEVTSSTAKVQLIVDRESRVAVRMAESRVVGSLDGNGRADLRLRLLDPNAIVTAGDKVVTSGESSVFPPAIPVGTVSRVEPQGGNVIRLAYVKPQVDFGALAFVLVVVDPEAANRPDPAPTPTASTSPKPGASPSGKSKPKPTATATVTP